MSLTSRIKEKADQLGFLRLGVARAESFPQLNYLEQWLLEGKHGEMVWMERTKGKRQHPDQVLPGVRSILVVGLNYYVPKPPAFNESAKVSRYAWGVDYHLIMEEKLGRLTRFVQNLLPDAQAKYYADTGPVMEKAWAERAGIGWIGKHTNLITPGHGSYLFLGEILLDRDLDQYDDPGVDLCGNCTLCIQACPTGALSPYQLDAAKCISYLTIEKKGAFSQNEKREIGEWVYGCDDCQEVCPWNDSPQICQEPGFNEINSSLASLSPGSIPEADFNRIFKQSPIKRLKYKGLVRNLETVEENKRLKSVSEKETTKK